MIFAAASAIIRVEMTVKKGKRSGMKKNYKKTLIACYLGFVTQAIAANFAPLLFLKFHND